MINKNMKERMIETHLRHYKTYKIGIINAQRQLDYIMPSLVSSFTIDNGWSTFHIGNDTEKVAIDRIESKRALDLKEEIEQYKLIVESIELALTELNPQERRFVELRYFDCLSIYLIKIELGYSEEKSVYRIRTHVLDKLSISLNNLMVMK